MPRLRRLDLIGGAPVRCRELQKVSASILKAALMLAGSGFGEDLFSFSRSWKYQNKFCSQ